MSEQAIHLRRVCVTYGSRHRTVPALRDVDLDIAEGEAVALLGPNGAGKTTLMHVLLGILSPASGLARVAGHSPRRAVTAGEVGAMLQSTGLMRQINVGELVRLVCALHGSGPDADRLLNEVGLTDLARRRATRLSGGQQQRLKLALALTGQPRLLLLDEPTAALDPQARQAFWASLRQRMAGGATVVFTTHLLAEAQAFASRVVVIRAGSVIADGSVAALVARLPSAEVSFIPEKADEARVAALRSAAGVVSVASQGGRLILTTTDVDATLAAVYASGARPRDVRIIRPSLEDAINDLIDQES